MSNFVAPRAVAQVRKSVVFSDRVLVTGASGWFGRTLAALLDGMNIPVMFISRAAKHVELSDFEYSTSLWDWNEVKSFAPTVVLDCAFVLRDYQVDMSLDEYVAANTILGSRAFQLLSLQSVRKFIYVSSGAAIANQQVVEAGLEADPYGFMKRSMEFSLRAISAEVGTPLVIVRPWSVSGTLVSRPSRYAFSNILQQALAGLVEITAAHQVWRRFVSIEDLLAVSMSIESETAFELNSGGELLEIGEFAHRVFRTLQVQPRISRATTVNSESDMYYSQDSSWDEACRTLHFVPLTLEEQILNVQRAL